MTDNTSAARSIARILTVRRDTPNPPDPDPACAFGLVVDNRLRDMAQDIQDLRATARWLLYLVAGGIVTAIVNVIVNALP